MATINTLKDRMNDYESVTDFKLTNRLPIVIVLNGRSFSKVTSLLEKPFSDKFMEVMSAVMIKLAHDVEGATFLYSFNDEIVLVLRNDQSTDTEAWYDNKLQKIVSVVSSIATLQFSKAAINVGLNLIGDPIFIANCFPLPNITESINFLVCKQQEAIYNAISLSAFHEMLKSSDIDTVKATLAGKSAEEKLEIIIEDCGIDYNKYPSAFRRGIACYRVPKLVPSKTGTEVFKNKWTIDTEIPIFTKEHNFLGNIFKSGRDIFRPERDI